MKRALGATTEATARYDFNRDGRINALDVAVLKQNLGRLLSPPGEDELFVPADTGATS